MISQSQLNNSMRKLFELDAKNYKENGTIFERPSARAIIIKDGKLAMVYSQKYDYYKFPGGGIDKNETKEEALIREVAEEAGLVVINDSIKEYGIVTRKEKGKEADMLLQQNYYYFCDVENRIIEQKLDDYEDEEGFILKWVNPIEIVDTNYNHDHKEKNTDRGRSMMGREARVIEMLIFEDLIK